MIIFYASGQLDIAIQEKIIDIVGLHNNNIFEKISSNSLKSQSRILAINHNFEMFFSRPIFGAGITSVINSIKYVADTSTTTYLLSIFGILGFQYTFYWVYGIMKNRKQDFYFKAVLAFTFLLILNKEPHFNLIFSWCLMFYFLQQGTQKILYKFKIEKNAVR